HPGELLPHRRLRADSAGLRPVGQQADFSAAARGSHSDGVSADHVIGDWGHTRLRLWRMENGAVAERREGPGIARAGDPAAALAEALGDWSAARIVLC